MRTGSSQEADASSVLLTEDNQEKSDTLMLMLTEKLSQSIFIMTEKHLLITLQESAITEELKSQSLDIESQETAER